MLNFILAQSVRPQLDILQDIHAQFAMIVIAKQVILRDSGL